MRNSFTTLALFGLVGLTAHTAEAQDNTILKPARLELGANFTTITGDGRFAGGPQLAINFNSRHALQMSADFAGDRRTSSWNAVAYYSVQYRYSLPIRLPKTRLFLTAGSVGFFGWSHYDAYSYTYPAESYVLNGQTYTIPARTISGPATTSFVGWPPVLPTGGFGFQHTINSRISVRGDVSAVAGLGWWVGLRASGGVVVPLGRSSR